MTEALNGPRYSPGSDTSEAAAEAVIPKVRRQRELVFDLIVRSGGCTDDEIETQLNLVNGGRARRFELVHEGRVKDSDKRRLTQQGHKAVVWEAAPEGHVYEPPPKMPSQKQCAGALIDLHGISQIANKAGYKPENLADLKALNRWLKHRAAAFKEPKK